MSFFCRGFSPPQAGFHSNYNETHACDCVYVITIIVTKLLVLEDSVNMKTSTFSKKKSHTFIVGCHTLTLKGSVNTTILDIRQLLTKAVINWLSFE